MNQAAVVKRWSQDFIVISHHLSRYFGLASPTRSSWGHIWHADSLISYEGGGVFLTVIGNLACFCPFKNIFQWYKTVWRRNKKRCLYGSVVLEHRLDYYVMSWVEFEPFSGHLWERYYLLSNDWLSLLIQIIYQNLLERVIKLKVGVRQDSGWYYKNQTSMVYKTFSNLLKGSYSQ